MTANEKPAISFSNVSKAFGDRSILKHVSFDVARGETLCIVGRSGTGKSVSLKLMVGLTKPDGGSIFIDGEDIAPMQEDSLSRVRRKIGFLFQSAALFDSFSLYDNLALPLQRFTSYSQQESEAIIQKRLDQVGLGNDLYKMPSELSGGMRKRAGLARALVLDPCILLVDEPSSGLDSITEGEIGDLLLQEKQHGKLTTVIVSHSKREARKLADRLLVLSEGKILALGVPGELQDSEDPLVRALVSEKY